MVIAAGVAAASIATAAYSATSASGAAGKQAAGAQLGIQAQQDQFKANQDRLGVYTNSGNTANQTLDALFGINPMGGAPAYDRSSPQGQALGMLEGLSGISAKGGSPSQAFNEAYSAFQNSPTYQFALQQGQQALDRSAASKGILLSGAQLKDAQKYGAGLASQGLSQFTSNLQNLYGNLVNGISGQAQMGLQANQSLVGAGTQTGQNVAQGYGNMGTAQAAGILGQSQAINQGLNNSLGYGLNRLQNSGYFNNNGVGSSSYGGGSLSNNYQTPAYATGNVNGFNVD